MDPRTLHRTWRHSHEEDQGGSLVFRPEPHPFPPSRGRYGFALQADGRMDSLGPSPADQPERRGGGLWRIDGESTLVLHEPGTAPRRFLVEEATHERLVLRPLD